nr:formin-like protein 3 [Lolium perenne]
MLRPVSATVAVPPALPVPHQRHLPLSPTSSTAAGHPPPLRPARSAKPRSEPPNLHAAAAPHSPGHHARSSTPSQTRLFLPLDQQQPAAPITTRRPLSPPAAAHNTARARLLPQNWEEQLLPSVSGPSPTSTSSIQLAPRQIARSTTSFRSPSAKQQQQRTPPPGPPRAQLASSRPRLRIDCARKRPCQAPAARLGPPHAAPPQAHLHPASARNKRLRPPRPPPPSIPSQLPGPSTHHAPPHHPLASPPPALDSFDRSKPSSTPAGPVETGSQTGAIRGAVQGLTRSAFGPESGSNRMSRPQTRLNRPLTSFSQF